MQATLEEVFGRRLRLARKQAKLSQERLAEKLDVSPTTIVNWEKGHNSPEFGRLQPLADLLGKPAAWFFHDDAADRDLLAELLDQVRQAGGQLQVVEQRLAGLLASDGERPSSSSQDELATRRRRRDSAEEQYDPAEVARTKAEIQERTAASTWPDEPVTEEAREEMDTKAAQAVIRVRRRRGKQEGKEGSGGATETPR